VVGQNQNYIVDCWGFQDDLWKPTFSLKALFLIFLSSLSSYLFSPISYFSTTAEPLTTSAALLLWFLPDVLVFQSLIPRNCVSSRIFNHHIECLPLFLVYSELVVEVSFLQTFISSDLNRCTSVVTVGPLCFIEMFLTGEKVYYEWQYCNCPENLWPSD
jgi:hypothetical protein